MFFYILLFMLSLYTSAEKCATPNKEEAECISLYCCPNLLLALGSLNPVSFQFVQQSNCGGTGAFPRVCCGQSSNFTTQEEKKPTESKNVDKMSLLPTKSYCGLQHSDDYFRDENQTLTRITEFPWLAAIVTMTEDAEERIECGGSLINRRYVLTAAHCLLSPFSKPVAVHLGEYDIHLQKDCVQEPPFEEECSEPLQVFSIEKIITHPYYSRLKNNNNDIALIRLNTTAGYNDYVRPVCLPFPGTTLAQVGDVLRFSGWGLKSFADEQGSIKKRVLSKLISLEDCKTHYPESFRLPITDDHICVTPLNNDTDVTCQGDSGGPLIFSKRAQWHQEGVSSFGKTCGFGSPSVYTKVANYLDWILDNIEQ